jgi:uncharacterized protein YcfJ
VDWLRKEKDIQMRTRWFSKTTVCIAAIAMASSQAAQAQSQTREGAALGGLAGAVIGGIVGHQNDEVAEGALIGGAVGAITGGVIGHAQQQRTQQPVHGRPYYQTTPVYRQQVQHRPAPYYTTSTTSTVVAGRQPVSVSDVITLTRNGVNETVIMNQIHSNGVYDNPDVNEVVLMHQQGVSSVIIAAMQQANIAVPSTVTTYSTPAPVVVERPPVFVEEHHPVIVTRPVYAPPVYHYHAHQPHYHRRSY